MQQRLLFGREGETSSAWWTSRVLRRPWNIVNSGFGHLKGLQLKTLPLHFTRYRDWLRMDTQMNHHCCSHKSKICVATLSSFSAFLATFAEHHPPQGNLFNINPNGRGWLHLLAYCRASFLPNNFQISKISTNSQTLFVQFSRPTTLFCGGDFRFHLQILDGNFVRVQWRSETFRHGLQTKVVACTCNQQNRPTNFHLGTWITMCRWYSEILLAGRNKPTFHFEWSSSFDEWISWPTQVCRVHHFKTRHFVRTDDVLHKFPQRSTSSKRNVINWSHRGLDEVSPLLAIF